MKTWSESFHNRVGICWRCLSGQSIATWNCNNVFKRTIWYTNKHHYCKRENKKQLCHEHLQGRQILHAIKTSIWTKKLRFEFYLKNQSRKQTKCIELVNKLIQPAHSSLLNQCVFKCTLLSQVIVSYKL